MLRTPVLLIIFNRTDTTQQVFDAIRQAQPGQLFVAADGPRENNQEDVDKCADVRRIIDEGIDWSCEVHRLYRDDNLGCRLAPASAIDWFFENVEAGIVLEDDCVPHPTFFPFCEELLIRYRDDERVMMISGFNPLGKWKSEIRSYHFSYSGGTWGWASWKRAWDYFDIDMRLWGEPEVQNEIRHVLCDMVQFNHWRACFDAVYCGKLDTAWDYQWFFARLLYSGLSIVPSVNLISNIGFQEGATHTIGPAYSLANLPLYSVPFPLKGPYGLTDDREYSRMSYLKTCLALDEEASFVQHMSRKVKELLARPVKGTKVLREALRNKQ